MFPLRVGRADLADGADWARPAGPAGPADGVGWARPAGPADGANWAGLAVANVPALHRGPADRDRLAARARQWAREYLTARFHRGAGARRWAREYPAARFHRGAGARRWARECCPVPGCQGSRHLTASVDRQVRGVASPPGEWVDQQADAVAPVWSGGVLWGSAGRLDAPTAGGQEQPSADSRAHRETWSAAAQRWSPLPQVLEQPVSLWRQYAPLL
jgi:hypothetical protein